MEITSHLVLSEYQRAILNEMGIMSWKFANTSPDQAQHANQKNDVIESSSGVTSRTDALVKLKQLKAQTQKNQSKESTDCILVACSKSDTKRQIFADVLLALGLETVEIKYVAAEQISDFSDYPLSWNVAEKVSFENNQLTTPTFKELNESSTKKRLWMQIQNANLVIEN
ncbi:MAG: DNA polymerase III subunit psi [Paraglaciecola sp.]|uniref:DNA polymerase III subunit psi n=1 Tax=Paraglaciecola sp. TaxID=1920173 RepID=UPI0032993D8E